MKKTIIILLTLMYCSELFSMQANKNHVQEIIVYLRTNEATKWELVKNVIEQKNITSQEKMDIVNYFGPYSDHYYHLFLLWHKDIGLASFFQQNRNEDFFNELINYVSGVSHCGWDVRILTNDFKNSCKTLYALIIKEYTQCININTKPSSNYVDKKLNQTPPMKLFSDIQEKALYKDPDDILKNKRRKEILKDLIKVFNKKIDLTIKNDDKETIVDLCKIKYRDACEIVENKVFLNRLLKKYVFDKSKLPPKSTDCFFRYSSKECL